MSIFFFTEFMSLFLYIFNPVHWIIWHTEDVRGACRDRPESKNNKMLLVYIYIGFILQFQFFEKKVGGSCQYHRKWFLAFFAKKL